MVRVFKCLVFGCSPFAVNVQIADARIPKTLCSVLEWSVIWFVPFERQACFQVVASLDHFLTNKTAWDQFQDCCNRVDKIVVKMLKLLKIAGGELKKKFVGG
jgi:hypothetical protein